MARKRKLEVLDIGTMDAKLPVTVVETESDYEVHIWGEIHSDAHTRASAIAEANQLLGKCLVVSGEEWCAEEVEAFKTKWNKAQSQAL